MSYLTKFAFCCIAATLVVLNFATTMIEWANYGRTEPAVLSHAELTVSDAPLANKFVRLNEFCFPGEPVLVESKYSQHTYIPLFSNEAEVNADTPISVVLKIESYSSTDLPKIRSILADQNTRIEGLCRSRLGRTLEHQTIQEQYARSATGAAVIDHDSTPTLGGLFGGVAIILTIYVLYAFGNLMLCKTKGTPNTKSARIWKVAIGVFMAIAGLALYSRCTGFIATAGIACTGYGLAQLFVGALALKIKNDLFTGNWFQTNSIAGDSQAFCLVHGRQSFTELWEDIEAVNAITWPYENSQQLPRHHYRFKCVAKGKQCSIHGRVLASELPTYVDAFKGLEKQIADQKWNKFLQGEEICGEGWLLNADALVIKQKRNEVEIPLEQIQACRLIEAEYRVWKKGTQEHIAAFPIYNLNVTVLHDVLDRLIATQLPSQRESRDDTSSIHSVNLSDNRSELGIIEFSGRAPSIPIAILVIASLAGIVLLGFEQWFLGSFVTFAALAVIVGRFALGQTVFRIHENGVSLVNGTSVEEIAFSELHALSFKSKCHMNGTYYEGDSYEVLFETESGGMNQKTIRFKTAKTLSDRYSKLATKAAGAILPRMIQQLDETGVVEWMPDCRLCLNGLTAPTGSLIQGKAQTIAYDRLSSTKLEHNRLLIYVDGKKFAFFKLDTTQMNFLPGYLLLLRILERDESEPVSKDVSKAMPLETVL